MALLTGRLGTTPRDQFAGEVLGRFQATPGLDQVWYDRRQFGLGVSRRRDAEPIWVPLSQAFEDFAPMEPTRRADVLTQYASAVGKLQTEVPWEQARQAIFPILKGSTFALRRPSPHAPMDRPDETEPIALLRRPAFPHLDELVLLQLPVASQYVSLARVARWGVSPDEVFDAARANLEKIAPDPKGRPPANKPNVIRLFAKGGLMASCVLLGGWLAYMALAVGGRPVAFPVDGDTLVIAPDDPGLLGELYGSIGVQYQQADFGLSPVGYSPDDDGAVAPLTVSDDHPLAPAIGRSENLLSSYESGDGRVWYDQPDAQAVADANDFATSSSITITPDGSEESGAADGEVSGHIDYDVVPTDH